MTQVDVSLALDDRKAFIVHCSNLYETNGSSPISDKEWDDEMKALKLLVPNDPFFANVGGIAEEHVHGTQYTHKYVMGSLNKDPNPEEFEKWFAKTYPDTHDLIAILDYKVDGVSLCLHYQDGELIRAVTRGNGVIGIDITPIASHVKGVHKKINAKGYVEIKGETYKRLDDFYSNWADEYANARNFVSGSLNLKLDDKHSADEIIKRSLNFLAYEVRGIEFETETKKVLFLDEMGFETLKDSMARIKCRDRSPSDVARAVKNYMDKIDRGKLPFLIDGVVFKLNNIKEAEKMGITNNRPKSSRAIKFEVEAKETILEGIDWQIGRTGRLTPVGLLKEVRLCETNVKRVTLHNLKEMERLGILQYGCTVTVSKGGEIIPKIVRKIKDNGGDEIKAPKRCPLCDTPLEFDDTFTTVWCKGENCPAQVTKNIDNYFKKMNVKGIGIGIIDKLAENKYVDCISDMYKLREKDQVSLKNLFGSRAYEKILESIDSVKETSLAQFIQSLGIGQVGRTASDITAKYPTIKDIDLLTVIDLVKIEGFSDIKASSFLNGWKKVRSEIDQILKFINIIEPRKDSDKLNGKSFCVTGTLNKERKEVASLIEANGGVIKGSVGSKLDYLVAGENAGSKISKARANGYTKIITEEELEEMMK